MSESETFNFETMQRLRKIADAADGWPIMIGVPDVNGKTLHLRVVEYMHANDSEKRGMNALLNLLRIRPSRNFRHERGVPLDGLGAGASSEAEKPELLEVPF